MSSYTIETYTDDNLLSKSIKRNQIRQFRELSFVEGNDSLSYDKYDPDCIDGETWMVYIDDELACISVVEASHYTSDKEVSARICRLHIAKQFRPAWLGIPILPLQIEWARQHGFKVLYFTHDVKARAINAMYQHKKFGGAVTPLQKEIKEMWYSDWYRSLKTDDRYLFQVDPNSSLLQYIYYWTLEENFTWHPKSNIMEL
jgi:GNAT superfamily N-acetyltransferase